MKNKKSPAYNISLDSALKQGGFYGSDGSWNSLVKLDGRILRGRVETLVIKKEQQQLFMHIKPFNKKKYRIPGGSFERDVPNYIQAQNEVNEEAKIKVKNIINTGIHYTKLYSNNTIDEEIKWEGSYTEIYLAEYDGIYTGHVDKKDEDTDMYTYGRFYNIRDIYSILTDEHKSVIDSIFTIIEKSSISENVIILQESTTPVHYYPYYTPAEMNKLGVFNESKNRYSDIRDEAIEWYHEYTDTLHNDDSENWLKELQYRYAQYQNESSLDNKQLVLNLGWNPEIPVTLENVLKASANTKKRIEVKKEFTIPLNENIIFDKRDQVFNLDKFENGESNIIFIIGLPGAGKTTLSETISEQYNAEIFHLDYFQSYHNLSIGKYKNSNDVSWNILKKYMKQNPKVEADSINFCNIDLYSFKEYFAPFFKWLIKELESDKGHKYIIEGIHPILFIKYKYIKKYPIYCVNTAAIKAMLRHWYRDEWSLRDIIHHGYGDILRYVEYDKEYTHYKDGIREDAVDEAMIYDPIGGGYIKSPFTEQDFTYTAKMLQSKLDLFHKENKYLCIKNRDIESDDGGWVFAEYDVSDKASSLNVMNFISVENMYIDTTQFPGKIEVPEAIKSFGTLKVIDVDGYLD